jgi:hypothetical protein
LRSVTLSGRNAMGRVALVDDEDYELVASHRWHVYEEVRKSGIAGPYAQTNIYMGGKHRLIKMHSLITGWELTDHIDGNGLNNQRYNLREATVSQNQANARPRTGGSSVYKGVCWHKGSRRWRAYIQVRKKQMSLGYFTDETDAAKAYDIAAREYFGEYAYLNFFREKRLTQ